MFRQEGEGGGGRARWPKWGLGLEKKQFVTHLGTCLQKELSLSCIFMRGVKRSEPYRRIGAMREEASWWQRYGGKAFARGGEAVDGVEGALGQGQTAGEVGVGGQGRGKPVPQPPDLVFGGKVKVVKPDACSGGGGALLGCAPVDEFGFGE